MSTTTTKHGLIKPELTDPADITQLNTNWDKIDEKLNAIPITSTVPSDAEMWIDPDEVSAEESHLTDTNNPHNVTAEQIGAAPAGDYATKAFVTNEIAKAALEGSDVDLSGFVANDGSTAMTGNLPMGGKKIVNLGTPTANTDAATKAYVDQMLPKSGGEVTGDLITHRVDVKPKGDGYAAAVRFIDDDGTVRATVGASTESGKAYIQNKCADTEYSEYFFTPTQDTNRTANGNYTLLTTKDPVKLNQGGTGTSVDLANAPNNAIVTKLSTDQYNQLYYKPTKNGAFYAEGENEPPKFGVLPIAQGGTGASTKSGAREALGAAAESHTHNFSEVDGTVPLSKGGTGTGSNLVNAPVNAVIRKAGTGYEDQLNYTQTKSGALYATGTDVAPQFGTLPLAQGGTGTSTGMANAPANAIIRKVASGSYLWYTATGNGAFYATSENGLPTFGTLPVAQGGTGVTTDSEIGLKAYPVGSIYISYNSTSPASRFGGTWTQIKDRFLLGVGDTYSAAKTGGSATHTLTENEMPSHAHSNQIVYGATGFGTHYNAPATTNNTGALKSDWTYYTGNSGGGEAHNNMPPYQTVYMWRRTA